MVHCSSGTLTIAPETDGQGAPLKKTRIHCNSVLYTRDMLNGIGCDAFTFRPAEFQMFVEAAALEYQERIQPDLEPKKTMILADWDDDQAGDEFENEDNQLEVIDINSLI